MESKGRGRRKGGERPGTTTHSEGRKFSASCNRSDYNSPCPRKGQKTGSQHEAVARERNVRWNPTLTVTNIKRSNTTQVVHV